MISIGIICSSPQIIRSLILKARFKSYKFVGIYYPTYVANNSQSLLPTIKTSNELLKKSDVILFLGYNKCFSSYITQALKNSKHVIVDKISMYSKSNIESFIKIAIEASSSFQIIDYWTNYSVIKNNLDQISKPLYIDFSYSLGFSTQPKEIEELKNYLSQSLYFIFCISNSNVKKTNIIGINTFSKELDFLNCSLDFDNGSAARLQLGAISNKKEINCTVHQSECIFSYDLSNYKTEISMLNVFKDIEHINFTNKKETKTEVFLKIIQQFSENIKDNNYTNKNLEICLKSKNLVESIFEKLSTKISFRKLEQYHQ